MRKTSYKQQKLTCSCVSDASGRACASGFRCRLRTMFYYTHSIPKGLVARTPGFWLLMRMCMVWQPWIPSSLLLPVFLPGFLLHLLHMCGLLPRFLCPLLDVKCKARTLNPTLDCTLISSAISVVIFSHSLTVAMALNSSSSPSWLLDDEMWS